MKKDDKLPLIEKLRKQLKDARLRPRTKAAWDFYRDQIQEIINARKFNRGSFMQSKALIKKDFFSPRNTFQPGQVLLFKYEAITYPERLKYYDEYPMVLVISTEIKNGKAYMHGLNFHYLPPKLRYSLMIRLLDLMSNDRYDRTTKFEITYEYLREISVFDNFKGAYKTYLISQFRSTAKQVEIKYLDLVLNLPMAKWIGQGSDGIAWYDTLRR